MTKMIGGNGKELIMSGISIELIFYLFSVNVMLWPDDTLEAPWAEQVT